MDANRHAGYRLGCEGPKTWCTSSCARDHKCKEGGIKCIVCGRYFCGDNIAEDGRCIYCHADFEIERAEKIPPRECPFCHKAPKVKIDHGHETFSVWCVNDKCLVQPFTKRSFRHAVDAVRYWNGEGED